MKITLFSAKPYDRRFFEQENAAFEHDLTLLETPLDETTARLAEEAGAVCAFVNDDLSRPVLQRLAAAGTRVIALRSAGFNHVDLDAADEFGLRVVRVPAYSPHAVAEHTVGLMLALNRRIHKAYNRVREGNFELTGLLGFDMHGKTVGVVGTGKIGACVVQILAGFGCRVLTFDPHENADCLAAGAEPVELPVLLREADVVTLHCPLVPATQHLIDDETLGQMKEGAMLINTSRGGLVDTRAVIAALKRRHLGSLGIDVYEEEAELFFSDHSGEVIDDDVFARLLTFPNVLITGHQAFFTHEALTQIARVTLQNVADIEQTDACENLVEREPLSND